MMKNTFSHTLAGILASLLVISSCLVLVADDDENEHEYERHHAGKYTRKHLPPVNNTVYEDSCGACHFAYQPQWLPEASWKKILGQLNDHHGEELELTQEEQANLLKYLSSNSADKSRAKRAVKIMQSLGRDAAPLRITDTPYIRRKHDELSPEVFKRPAIESRSNCMACHRTADKGIYDDDDVRIPR